METLKLPVSVFGLEEDLGEVKVTASTTGPPSCRLRRANDHDERAGDTLVTFDLEVGEATGLGTIEVTASTGRRTRHSRHKST